MSFHIEEQTLLGAILGAFFGFFVSFFVPHVQNIIGSMFDRRKLKLQGFWIEIMPDGKSSHVSIGSMRFSVLKNRFIFDGMSFDKDGNLFAEWSTISSHLDYFHKKFHYSFITKFLSDRGVDYYGYGVVDLSNKGNYIMPTSGCFINVDKSAEHIPVLMIEAPKHIRHLNENLGREVVEYVRKYRESKVS